ncbi:hypothetical protein VEGS18_A19770 [Escherichia coli]|nr:hypothetical protein VEGS18_A19770 [Escherichia coli]
MKPVKPPRINGRVPVLSAQEAVNYIPDEATLCVLGAGGGILEATTLITALADKYKQTQTPRNLSIIREGANKQVISSQVDSLIKISRIWANFFPANTSNQPI